MTALSKTLGRGLVILALSSVAFACGDDDGGGKTSPDAGGAGSGAGGSGSDDGGAGSGSVGVAACVTKAKMVTMNMTSDECLSCACTEGETEVTACNANCWALIDCFGTADKCADVDTADTPAAVACASMKCPMVALGMAVANGPMAEAVGAVISSSCSMQCASGGGADGGAGTGAGDAGGDTDAGDTDGGA